ncbi:MAG: cysteine--tRNA ligase [Phycisphaerae bacterium]
MMQIMFYNTLHHRLDEFAAAAEGLAPDQILAGRTIRIYSCGPTVYDFAHIGNFRAFVFADVLCRFLELCGASVLQVMNMTDVGHMTQDDRADGGGEDKLAVAVEKMKASKKAGRAPVDNPDDPFQVADYYAREFLSDARAMRLRVLERYDAAADTDRDRIMPRPTRHIGEFIKMIQTLLHTGHAYIGADGVVYYDIGSFPSYGRLSGNSVDRLSHGAGGRTAEHAAKRHPADFFLWKPDPHHIMRWPSPWGEGYPGWHIECSSMAMEILGPELDIHTGGEDNIFPHHECEIAQSEGCTNRPFARFWMHTRHLMVDGIKMSKSKGNFYTIRDLVNQGFDPLAIRFALLSTRYRESMNFSLGALHDAAAAVESLRDLAERALRTAGSPIVTPGSPALAMHEPELNVLRDFMIELGDDLNMAGALGRLFTWSAEQGKTKNIAADRAGSIVSLLKKVDSVLDVIFAPLHPLAADTATKIDALMEERAIARRNRDFARSDQLRDEIQRLGAQVQDSQAGSTWRRRLAPAR